MQLMLLRQTFGGVWEWNQQPGNATTRLGLSFGLKVLGFGVKDRGYTTTRNPYCFLIAGVGFDLTTFGLWVVPVTI